jgi:hypothetical protein
VSRFRSILFAASLVLAARPCLAQFPPPVPPGPLGDVDTAFLSEYTARTKATIATNPPFVEIVGSSLYLHHGGHAEPPVRVLDTIYHALKDVTHVPFTIYLRLSPLTSVSLSDDQIAQIRILQGEVTAAENALQSGGFSETQTVRQKQILDASTALLQTIIQTKHVDRSSLESYTQTMAPLMLKNADEAGCYQVQATHAQLMKWKATLSNDEWAHLIAVNKGAHQARYRNAATQYFEWLFQGAAPSWAYPGESGRVLYAESMSKDQTGGDELVSVLIDADASRAFFGNEWRMSEDILSDGAARCIAQLPKTDRVWQPHLGVNDD